MNEAWPKTLVLVGAGKMGGALLRRWIEKGLPPSAIRVFDPQPDSATSAYCQAKGVDLGRPAQPPDALVLAVKPQTFSADPDSFASLTNGGTLVISILAGKTLSNLRAALPDAGTIVRAMPNLAASVGRGATGLSAEPQISSEQKRVAHTLLEAVGHVEWLDENLIDAVTAVSGSGPAYVFYLTECLAEAGVAAGLPQDVAARLARATVEGAAALMAAEPDRSPAALREAVTSPGGTTAAALAMLGGGEGLARLMTMAVDAAKRRASELAE